MKDFSFDQDLAILYYCVTTTDAQSWKLFRRRLDRKTLRNGALEIRTCESAHAIDFALHHINNVQCSRTRLDGFPQSPLTMHTKFFLHTNSFFSFAFDLRRCIFLLSAHILHFRTEIAIGPHSRVSSTMCQRSGWRSEPEKPGLQLVWKICQIYRSHSIVFRQFVYAFVEYSFFSLSYPPNQHSLVVGTVLSLATL